MKHSRFETVWSYRSCKTSPSPFQSRIPRRSSSARCDIWGGLNLVMVLWICLLMWCRVTSGTLLFLQIETLDFHGTHSQLKLMSCAFFANVTHKRHSEISFTTNVSKNIIKRDAINILFFFFFLLYSPLNSKAALWKTRGKFLSLINKPKVTDTKQS